VNRLHRFSCRADRWRHVLQECLLPWALRGVELGPDVLEIGPGPGLATEVLRPGGWLVGSDSTPSLLFRLAHLGDTMVLVDPEGLAARLEAAGFAGGRVDVARGAFRFRARRPAADAGRAPSVRAPGPAPGAARRDGSKSGLSDRHPNGACCGGGRGGRP